jgi:hypothetical protein
MNTETVKNKQKAGSLHETGSLLHELERRINEAHKRFEDAYWMSRPCNVVEQRIEEYADAKREYRAALESRRRAALHYADYILNHYSRDSHPDKLSLAKDLERHGWTERKRANAELSDSGPSSGTVTRKKPL